MREKPEQKVSNNYKGSFYKNINYLFSNLEILIDERNYNECFNNEKLYAHKTKKHLKKIKNNPTIKSNS